MSNAAAMSAALAVILIILVAAVMMLWQSRVNIAPRPAEETGNLGGPSGGLSGGLPGALPAEYSVHSTWNNAVGTYLADLEIGGSDRHPVIPDTGSPYLQVHNAYPCPGTDTCTASTAQVPVAYGDGTKSTMHMVRTQADGGVKIGGAVFPRGTCVGAVHGQSPGSLGSVGTLGLGSVKGNRAAASSCSLYDSLGAVALRAELGPQHGVFTFYTTTPQPPAGGDSMAAVPQATLESLGVRQPTNLLVIDATCAGVPGLKYAALDTGSNFTHLPVEEAPDGPVVLGGAVEVAVRSESFRKLPSGVFPPGFGVIGVNDLKGSEFLWVPGQNRVHWAPR